MAWIRVVGPGEAEGQLLGIYEEVGRRRGSIANVYRVHSLNPRALQAHLDLYMAVLYRRGGLSRAQREMIGVHVSGLNGCRYCVVHHAEALARHENSVEVVEAALPRNAMDAPISPRDRAMLAYATKLSNEPEHMGEADVERLRRHGFDDEAILDINLITSYFNFVNRVVQGLGVELEPADRRDYKY